MCVVMGWLFSYNLARWFNKLCSSCFEKTLTAVALLLHLMENSIVLTGLRAMFSDWLHPITITNQITVLFEACGAILDQDTLQEVRGMCVCSWNLSLLEAWVFNLKACKAVVTE